MSGTSHFKRILLKASGEALMGDQGFGIDPAVTSRLANDVRQAIELGVEIAIVIGGGNIFRGVSLAAQGADRVTGDHMGMLATVMNALALRMAFKAAGIRCEVLSAIDMPEICETFNQRRMNELLSEKTVLIFAGGTGNPFFTTDTAAALRACEMNADGLFKGTQVDGIYSADPKKVPDAERFETISHSEVLERGLEVMDASAVSLTKSADIPIVVFSLHEKEGLAKILKGEGRCTTVRDN